MQLKPLIFSFLATSLISACSDEDENSNDDGINPSSYELNVEAFTINDCDYKSPASSQDTMIIIHNDDFSPKSFLYPNAEGVITYTSSDEKLTYSVVENDDRPWRDNPSVYISTYVDALVEGIEEIAVYNYDDTDCVCSQTNSTINLPADSGKSISRIMGMSYSLDNREPTSASTSVQGTLCKNLNNDAVPIAVQVDHDNGQSAAYVADYQIDQDININYSGISPNLTVTTIDGSMPDRMNAYSFTDSGLTLYTSSYDDFDGTGLYLYDFAEIDTKRVGASHISYVDSDLGDVTVETSHYIYVDDVQQQLDIDLTKVVEFTEFDENDFSYNFSDNSVYDAANIRIAITDENFDFTWNIRTPLDSKLPAIENMSLNNFNNLSDIQTLNGSMNFSIGVSGYKDQITSYDEFITAIQKQYVATERASYSEYYGSYIDFTIDNLGELSNKSLKTPIAEVVNASSF